LGSGGQVACMGYITLVVEGTCNLVVPVPSEGEASYVSAVFGDFVELGDGGESGSWFVDGVVVVVAVGDVLLLVVIVFEYCDSIPF